MRFLATVTILCCATTTCVAQEFRSPQAKKAVASYKAEMKRLDDLYVKAVDAAKKKYAENLESARKSALISDDLDEAQRIIEVKKSLEEGSEKGSEKGPEKASGKSDGEVPWYVGTQWTSKKFLHKDTRHWPPITLERGDSFSWYAVNNENRVLAVERGKKTTLVFLWAIAPDRKSATVLRYEQRGEVTAQRAVFPYQQWMLRQERERTVCAQRFAFHFSVISAFSIFIFPDTTVRCAAYRRSSFARRH